MKIVAVKTKLFKTESITEKNVVEAVRHINQTLLEDHNAAQKTHTTFVFDRLVKEKTCSRHL